MKGRAARLARFLRGSYPPLPSLVFAALWAYGVTGLFAALGPGSSAWRPGPGTAVAAATLFVDLLLMRALDDIRDLDYDRRFEPARPLAAGEVRTDDLAVLYGAGVLILVVLNAAWPWRAGILLVQLGYAAGAIAVYLRWRRPSADNLFASLLVGLPVPVLLHLYLYAGHLDVSGQRAGASGAVAVAVVVLAAGHPELARKITRAPRAGERTYVTTLGVTGAVSLALAVPALSAVLLAAFSRAPAGWTLAALVPLFAPALAARAFRRGRTRWPPAAPALYMLLAFASYVALGLAR
ncbi:hypothetical protein [Actinomadura sp. 7K507]|uniref:hypothetical protein n=1 Tax=Actinomadura sp. 7K507 TaxID=2530365 RepID=UPI00104C21F7|nr:hypothetical protein [Actinomadura sp. 7K507]TDC75537.1 hypothetical protein E1285_41070 [Actinomadura sp. 7K507]